MTEQQLRDQVCSAAASFVGCSESDGSHRAIIDLYNSHKPLARGYAMTYDDPWCAAFVAAVAVRCGLTDIMPTECSCEMMIKLYQKLGRWEEDESVIPEPGDIIFYDWDDSGIGNNTGIADHTGIVIGVEYDQIRLIEGNVSDSVSYRVAGINSRYIRGFGRPDYASKARSTDIGTPSDWAQMSCMKAVSAGVFNGDGLGGYNWQDPLTREQMCVILDNLGLT